MSACPKLEQFVSKNIPTEYYILIHEKPNLVQCGHLLCTKENEINIWYHAWLFADLDIDENFESSQSIPMGIFNPKGILKTHQKNNNDDEEFCGMEFNKLSKRKVTIVSNLKLSIWTEIVIIFISAQPTIFSC